MNCLEIEGLCGSGSAEKFSESGELIAENFDEDFQTNDAETSIELNFAVLISRLIDELPMFAYCQAADLGNSKWLEERVVNIPSSARVAC